MFLADIDNALKMGLICAVVGGAIGALVGLIRGLVRKASGRGTAADYVGWMKHCKPKEDDKK
jgi:hypothetical protein